MVAFLGEFIGTALLLAIGSGVVANEVLQKTKGHNTGWVSITLGWGIGVFLGVYASTAIGGSGHLNPAFTIGMAVFGDFDPSLVAPYLLAQFSGALVGSVLGWAAYYQHFAATDDANLKLAVFSTIPAIPHTLSNLITEIIGTFVLVFGALLASAPTSSLGALDALPVGLLVIGIGLGLGGATGYAINPARDLGPRIAHFLLPIPGKRDSDWSYSWIPVVGPIVGGLLGAYVYQLL